jgi:hypothetical protein
MGYVDASISEQVIASDWHTLTSQDLANPLDITELRGATTTPAWSFTMRSGNPPGGIVHCQNWTNGTSGVVLGSTGQPGEVNSDWTFSGAISCPNPRSLYCFQQA